MRVRHIGGKRGHGAEGKMPAMIRGKTGMKEGLWGVHWRQRGVRIFAKSLQFCADDQHSAVLASLPSLKTSSMLGNACGQDG